MKRILTKSRQAKDLKGFTLIELLVVTVIMVIVFWAALDFFNSQQTTFRVQASQSENQSNLRMGLFYLGRDVSDAGFTGSPFGIETEDYRALSLGAASTVVPVQSIDFGHDNNFIPYKLTNQTGHTVDGLIIYGNYDPNGSTSHLSNPATMGMSLISANTVTMFQNSARICAVATLVCSASVSTVSPYGFIVTDANGNGEYEQVTSANPSGKTITLANPIKGNFIATSLIAPVYKRAYYIRVDPNSTTQSRWLVRRDFYAGNVQSDTKIAQGVYDMQITYDMTDSNGKIHYGMDPNAATIDPRFIVAVNVQMTTVTTDPSFKRSMNIVMTRKIRMMNVGILNELKQLPPTYLGH